jgi:segregation and condensation protein B
MEQSTNDNLNNSPQTPHEDSLRPDFLALPRRDQLAAVEALLFASEEPLSAKNLYDLLVVGEELEKKVSGKTATNGKNGHAKTNGKSNGHAKNGAAKQETDEASIDEPLEAISDFEDVTLQVAHFRVEPPEGFAEEALHLRDEDLLKPTEADTFIGAIIAELNAEFEATHRVFRIVEVAREDVAGFQFGTKAEFGELLVRLVKSKSKKRLSKAALETLAIIAYRQPVSKPELEVIRGVGSNEIINRLLEKNLITIVGRSESVGKPLLYGTTDEFLRLFGLHSLSDLPKPRELEELMAERADILEVAQAVNQAEMRDLDEQNAEQDSEKNAEPIAIPNDSTEQK